MKKSNIITSVDPVIIFMALLSVVIHLACANNLEYHRDEMLYFVQGMHPAAGYNSVPPVTGLIAWLMQNLFGYSVFAVRLFPALLGGALILLTASIVRELGGSRYAAILSSTGLLISIFFQRAFFLFQPVHIEIFLWTLIIFLVVRYINTLNAWLLFYIGVASGFAMLNKYLAGILISGLFVVVLFTKYRDIFREKKFLAGIAAGSLIFLPNILWQIHRGFPVFNHFSELYDSQLVHMDIPLFLKEQLMMSFFGSVFTIAGIYALLFSQVMKKYRLLGFLSLYVILSLMLLKGKSYYTLGVFPLLIAAGAVFSEKIIEKGWIRIAFPTVLILLSLPIIPVGIPVFRVQGMIKYFEFHEKKLGNDMGRRFEDGSVHSLPQDYADMIGWEELTAIASKAYAMVNDKNSVFIYGDNYGEASALTLIGKKYGLPEAVSFSESFQYWYPAKFDPDITALIYINEDEPGEDVLKLFSKVTKVGSISNPHAREYGTSVWLFEDPVSSFNSFWIERTKTIR